MMRRPPRSTLFPYTPLCRSIRAADAIFICVGTPPKDSGEADLSAIDNVARQIAAEAKSSKLVIEKSTVPARTGLELDRKSTRLNSSHSQISYAVFCLKKKRA